MDNPFYVISLALFVISVTLSLLLYNYGNKELGEAGLWVNIIFLVPTYMIIKSSYKK